MSALRLLTAVAAAAITLACAASTASATTATISPSGTFSMTSASPIRLSAGIINWTCDVTLNGTLNASTATRAGEVIGQITGGTADHCVGGTMTVDTSTPWDMTIAALLGTLPNFAGVLVNIRTVHFTWLVAGQTCIYAGTIGALIPNDNGANAAGSMSLMNWLANSIARQTGSSALCPTTGSISVPLQFRFDQLRSLSIS